LPELLAWCGRTVWPGFSVGAVMADGQVETSGGDLAATVDCR
jgi:hypothetical protein